MDTALKRMLFAAVGERSALAVCLFVLGTTACGGAQAGVYYVDSHSPSANDRNDGQTPDSAWLTLASLRTTSFSPGDAILLRRGGLWRESLLIRGVGTPHQPITLGAYGTGARPIVDGSLNVSTPEWSWTRSLTNPSAWYLRTAARTAPSLTEPGGLWCNHHGYFSIDAANSGAKYTAPTLIPRTWCWGDWDNLGFNTVYCYSPDDLDASNDVVDISQRSYCLYFPTGQHNWIVQDIELRQSGLSSVTQPALYVYQATNIVVRNCHIHDTSGQVGAVYLMRAAGFQLLDSTIANAYDPDGNGYGSLLYAESSDKGHCSGTIVSNCVFYGCYARHADLVGMVGTWVDGVVYGFTNCVITHNEFAGPAQNAIYMRTGACSNRISNNYIRDIKGYSVNGGIGIQLRDHVCHVLACNNVLLNCYGPVVQSDGKNGGPGSVDASCRGVVYANNTIISTPAGNGAKANAMHFFGTNHELTVQNNLVVSHDGDLILLGRTNDTTYSNIRVSNNRYFKTGSSGYCFVYRGRNCTTFDVYLRAISADNPDLEAGSSYGDPGVIELSATLAEHVALRPRSPCVGAGVAVPGFADDFTGRLRGRSWDIGAMQFHAAPSPPRLLPPGR